MLCIFKKPVCKKINKGFNVNRLCKILVFCGLLIAPSANMLSVDRAVHIKKALALSIQLGVISGWYGYAQHENFGQAVRFAAAPMAIIFTGIGLYFTIAATCFLGSKIYDRTVRRRPWVRLAPVVDEGPAVVVWPIEERIDDPVALPVGLPELPRREEAPVAGLPVAQLPVVEQHTEQRLAALEEGYHHRMYERMAAFREDMAAQNRQRYEQELAYSRELRARIDHDLGILPAQIGLPGMPAGLPVEEQQPEQSFRDMFSAILETLDHRAAAAARIVFALFAQDMAARNELMHRQWHEEETQRHRSTGKPMYVWLDQ